jgi:thymidylate synthase (FAD)
MESCKGKEIKILDKGHIRIEGVMGDDLTVVNSARVSFGKRKEVWDEKDAKLVRYLAKNKHFSPFRHLQIQLNIKAPEFVMRQLFRHVVGIEATSNYPTKDTPWNEISGRYVPVKEYYYPEVWRKQSQDNKQASEGKLDYDGQETASSLYRTGINETKRIYEELVNLGVAKEQARSILPLSQYTQVWWTASFQSIMNFIDLRDEKTAQWEIQQYAKVLKEIMLDVFPETTKLWEEVYWNED